MRVCGKNTENRNFYPEVNVPSRFLEITHLLAAAYKRMYLWNASSYDNDVSLILKEIYCTLTWYRKLEIDGQREMVPFLRSYHIYAQSCPHYRFKVCINKLSLPFI